MSFFLTCGFWHQKSSLGHQRNADIWPRKNILNILWICAAFAYPCAYTAIYENERDLWIKSALFCSAGVAFALKSHGGILMKTDCASYPGFVRLTKRRLGYFPMHSRLLYSLILTVRFVRCFSDRFGQLDSSNKLAQISSSYEFCLTWLLGQNVFHASTRAMWEKTKLKNISQSNTGFRKLQHLSEFYDLNSSGLER